LIYLFWLGSFLKATPDIYFGKSLPWQEKFCRFKDELFDIQRIFRLNLETLAKIVTPVKTGVQRYLNLLEITGFRLLPE
jgi:hypothetical protein